MKSILGGFLLVSAIIWSLWAMVAKDDCKRVERFAAPVNFVSWGVRSLTENWTDRDDRYALMEYSADSREFVERLIARTFFSKDLVCSWSKKDGE